MALALRDLKVATRLIGVDANEAHAKKAVELGLVDEIADLKKGVENAKLVIVAIPVHAAEDLLPQILDHVSDQVVMDVSSPQASAHRFHIRHD